MIFKTYPLQLKLLKSETKEQLVLNTCRVWNQRGAAGKSVTERIESGKWGAVPAQALYTRFDQPNSLGRKPLVFILSHKDLTPFCPQHCPLLEWFLHGFLIHYLLICFLSQACTQLLYFCSCVVFFLTILRLIGHSADTRRQPPDARLRGANRPVVCFDRVL